jgi:hypothetical protein
MFRASVVLLLIMISGSASNRCFAEGKSRISDPSNISASSLFKSSEYKRSLVSDPTYQGDYRYVVELDKTVESIFLIHIEDLYNAFSERVVGTGEFTDTVNFAPSENIKLGIDLNFDVGKVLSKDSDIVSILKIPRAAYARGVESDDSSYVNTFIVIFVTKNSHKENSITVGRFFEGYVNTEKYSIGFGQSLEPQDDKLYVSIRDRTKQPLKKLKRGNDVYQTGSPETIGQDTQGL